MQLAIPMAGLHRLSTPPFRQRELSHTSRRPARVRPPGAWVVQLAKVKSCPCWQPWLMSLLGFHYEDRGGVCRAEGGSDDGDVEVYPDVVRIARAKYVNLAVP